MYCFSLNFLSLIILFFSCSSVLRAPDAVPEPPSSRRRHRPEPGVAAEAVPFQIGKIHIAAEFSIFIYIDPNVNDNRILFT